MSGENRTQLRFKYKLKTVLSAVLASTLRKSAPYLALSAAFAASPAPPPNPLDTLRSGSFANSRPALTSASVLNWNIDRGKHLRDIEDQIRRQNPDLCIFQEVDLDARRSGGIDVARTLAETFRMNYVFAPEFQELSQGTGGEPAFHGQALLTRLPIRASRILRFQHQSGFWKPQPFMISALPLFQRRRGGRIALVTELDNAAKPLVIYDLHLESKGTEDLRLQQLDEVLEDAKRYSPETSIVIAGDLNTFMLHSKLIPRLRQAGYRSAFGDRHMRTHVLIGDLDWVFARGPIQFGAAEVVRAAHGSDHFPITVNVRL